MVYKYFTKATLLFAFTIIGSGTLDAQENDSLLPKMIQSQQYVFVPRYFSSPTVNMPINTMEYQLRITTDSIITILPYFGKSYTAQFGRSDDNSIRFTSTDFKYSAVAKKKGKWEIAIEPKDAKGVRLFMIVFNNGEAQLDVISPGRESMLFKGYVFR